MKITSVRSFLLSYPFAEPVRLPFYGGERTHAETRRHVHPRGGGQRPGGLRAGTGQRERTQRSSGRRSRLSWKGACWRTPTLCACCFCKGRARTRSLAKIYCAVEIALYDLAGKARGIPVSEMLGGRVRDRIRLYGSAGMYMSPEAYAAEASAIAELGFRAYKMRPAVGPEQDLETVRLMRQAVGPDFDLMVDAHTWWRMGDRSYVAGHGGATGAGHGGAPHRVARRAAAAGRPRGLPRVEGEGPGAAGRRASTSRTKSAIWT